jgi:hypothetical protein
VSQKFARAIQWVGPKKERKSTACTMVEKSGGDEANWELGRAAKL